MTGSAPSSAFRFAPDKAPLAIEQHHHSATRSVWGGVWNETVNRLGARTCIALMAKTGSIGRGVLFTGNGETLRPSREEMAALHRLLTDERGLHPGAAASWFPLLKASRSALLEQHSADCSIVISRSVGLANGETFWPVLGFARSSEIKHELLDAAAERLALAALAETREIALRRNLSTFAQILDEIAAGVILLDDTGRILWSNWAVSFLLDERAVISQSLEGRLALSGTEETGKLLSAIAALAQAAARGQSPEDRHIPLNGDTGAGVLTLRPLQSGSSATGPFAILALISQSAIPRAAFEPVGLFGLIPSEARLVKELLCAGSLNAAAPRLGISEQTARTYLKRIFTKLGIGSQLELARLMTAIAPLAISRARARHTIENVVA